MWPLWIRFVLKSIPCLVDSSASATHHNLEFSRFWKNGFPNVGFEELSFTWYCRSRWCLQLSPCILNDVFVIFIAWINGMNSRQISGIIEFRLLDCPFLFFSFLSGFPNSRPSVWPYMILDVVSFEFLSVSPQTTCPLEVFPFNKVNFVNPVHESDNLSTSSILINRFSCATSRSVCVDLITAMYFSGMVNISSSGTKIWTRVS